MIDSKYKDVNVAFNQGSYNGKRSTDLTVTM